ncbi:MAG: hypothetical protein IPO08_05315 [Xanthomonadales bacterium]|nr:hypothetical protein [Xanthomonadales bacterium]
MFPMPDPDIEKHKICVPGFVVLLPRTASAWSVVEKMTGAVRTAAHREMGIDGARPLEEPRQ